MARKIALIRSGSRIRIAHLPAVLAILGVVRSRVTAAAGTPSPDAVAGGP
jgi:hypothetical protein